MKSNRPRSANGWKWPWQLPLLAMVTCLPPSVSAVNYEVYPGSAFYLTQMVDRVSWSYVADNANGFYYHPVGFSSSSDYTLSTAQKQSICNNFSNRFALVEGDMGNTDPTADLGDIQTIAAFGLKPFTAFVNRIAGNTAVWRQLVANNASRGASSMAMMAPHRTYLTAGGWYDPSYWYAHSNTVVTGCSGSGVDAPVYLYVHNGSWYRQVIWDQRDWTVSQGRKFNYIVSPNNSTDQQLMLDTLYLVRTLEDGGHEADIYSVELYGQRPVQLTPETTNYNGIVQANWTITGQCYYLLKHRDGEPGTLDLFATGTNGTRYAQGVCAPILTNAAQVVPFNPAQSNWFTLTLTNLSRWLDYAAVLRARVGPGQLTNWNVTFKSGSSNISSAVLSDGGFVFLGGQRLLPLTNQLVTLSLSPKGAPTPLDLVVEALPHAGVDQALDTIAFQYLTNQTPPTLALPTTDRSTRQGMPTDPIWFTVGDAETLASALNVSVVSSNEALVPSANCVLARNGIQRILTVQPAPSQWGTAPITVTVSDGQFTTSKTFDLFVERTNIVTVLKANNALNLDVVGSWTSNAVPGQYDLPVWANIVTAANGTILARDLYWAGLRISNPGGPVSIGGTNLLSLGLAGIDMSSASQNLTLGTDVDLEEMGSWNVAAGRTLTMSGAVSGQGGFAKSGSGTALLVNANSFIGQVSASAGTLFLPQAGQQSSTVISSTAVVRIADNGSLGTGNLTLAPANNDTGRLELSNNITVLAGKTVSLNARSSSTDAIRNVSGTNTLAGIISFGTGGGNYWIQSDSGQLTLAGKITSAATGNRTLTVRGAGTGVVTGVIEDGSATMNVAKSDAGTWSLAGTNTYDGATTVNAGTLSVTGLLGGAGAVSIASSGTLAGSGLVMGPVTVQSGGTLAPGVGGIGTLTVSNSLTLNSGSFALMELKRSPRTNDLVAGLSTVTYAGTLTVTNLGGTLLPGDSFKLFSATNYDSAFTQLNLPPLSSGLGWSNRLAVDGTLAVTIVSPPALAWQTTLTNTVILSWPSYYSGYHLQGQTNAAPRGLSTNWHDVAGGSTPPVIVRLNPAAGSVFFRLLQTP
jgi:autotransporter-associated beta strand protein